MKHVVILGAGISGLAAGWFLKQRFGKEISLTILEKSSRSGGWIQTISKEGFLFEQGPRSCRTAGTGMETVKLIEQLGLQNEVITAHPSAGYRFLYRKKKLEKLPYDWKSFVFSSHLPQAIKAMLRDFKAPKGKEKDESVHAFISRRLGNRIAEEWMDPLVAGIYAGNIRELSMKACFPKFVEWEERSGTLLKGMLQGKKNEMLLTPFQEEMKKTSLFSFRKGMGTLTEALAEKLKPYLWYDTSVHRLPFDKADHIISTLPAHAMATLVQKEHPGLSLLLQQIKGQSVTVVNLGYNSHVINKQGFGYLIPSSEQEEILGVVWDSCVFPEQNGPGETRLTVMLKGAVGTDALQTSLNALHKHMGISTLPTAYHIQPAENAIPQYRVGHLQLLSDIESYLRHSQLPLSLLGSSYQGVSVNDCIANASKLVNTLNL